ncbi:MAG: hypothetical protein GY756_22640 [bacterium]|nr:hypothetical protein [bacterium]
MSIKGEYITKDFLKLTVHKINNFLIKTISMPPETMNTARLRKPTTGIARCVIFVTLSRLLKIFGIKKFAIKIIETKIKQAIANIFKHLFFILK